jgi:hypothetical protein
MKTSKTITRNQPTRDKLEREAALFYSGNQNDRTEVQTFQKASIRSLLRGLG